MHTNQVDRVIPSPAPLRACVHDLRNLFAVVASARSLLERPLDEQKKRLVLDALGQLAIEGKTVTDRLLSGGMESRGSDAAAELQDLAPMVQTLARTDLAISLSVENRPGWIFMAPTELRAVVLELITNAAAAGARKIRLRAACRGRCYWLSVADDGTGFSTPALTPVPAGPAGLHGTGMRRLADAVRAADGKVRIRSRIGRGSVVTLILPLAATVPGTARGRTPAARSFATA